MKTVNPALVSEQAMEQVAAMMAPKSEDGDAQPELQPAPAQ